MDEETRIPFSPTQSLPRVGKVASGASRIGFQRDEKERRRSFQVRHYTKAPERRRKKKATPPRCAPCPFQGKGLAWTLPPSYGRRCPEGAEVGWGKRDEKERGRSSQAGNLRKYPSAADAVPLPHTGKATIRENRFPHNIKAKTRICEKRITTDKAFPAWGRWRA